MKKPNIVKAVYYIAPDGRQALMPLPGNGTIGADTIFVVEEEDGRKLYHHQDGRITTTPEGK